MRDRCAEIAGQVARIERAAAFLANGLSLGACPHAAARRRDAMSARLIGNGLRELDLFLTDLIVEAGRIDRLGAAAGRDPGMHPGRRIFSAAEAWRRAEPHLGLAADARDRLRQMRAAQNRQCFGRLRGDGAEAALQRACADYARLAGDVLAALRARGGSVGLHPPSARCARKDAVGQSAVIPF
ncbi:hypothetical protein Q4610_05425 [Sphingobium sp. HBC34]|uniref:Uncharacterized protein n=1 Tax=Sphingobium cyanobacteriorum TaxID=3063954 RepID=A0ABT8ZJ65_9SPHN|nr:hypothetical protein [Sphingobium sp. HBC34]MDO7834481.1 hypothetical protein [Sphingobium sp. HBC34]